MRGEGPDRTRWSRSRRFGHHRPHARGECLRAVERSKTALFRLITDASTQHARNLYWGIKPLRVTAKAGNFEGLVALADAALRDRGLLAPGDRFVVVGWR